MDAYRAGKDKVYKALLKDLDQAMKRRSSKQKDSTPQERSLRSARNTLDAEILSAFTTGKTLLANLERIVEIRKLLD